MKEKVKKLVNRFGFQLSKSPYGDAFGTLRHMFGDKENLVIFDVGAYQGHVALRFSELFPQAKIFAFEPFEASYEEARKNTRSCSRIECFNFGFSDNDGKVRFNQNRGKATNSLLESNPEGESSWGTGILETEEVVEVEMRKLDNFIAEKNLEHIDILKLDVQGAEYLVIEGAKSACSRGMVAAIYSEVIAQPTYVGQRRFDQGLRTFYDVGFDLVNFFDISVRKDGILRQVDAIFKSSVQR